MGLLLTELGDMITYFGTFGFFMTLFLLFCRFLPLIAISEVKGVTPQADPHSSAGRSETLMDSLTTTRFRTD